MTVTRRGWLAASLVLVTMAALAIGLWVVYKPAAPLQEPQAVKATQEAKAQAVQAARDLKAARVEWDRKGVKAVNDAVQGARNLSGDAIADAFNNQLARFRGGEIFPSRDIDP